MPFARRRSIRSAALNGTIAGRDPARTEALIRAPTPFAMSVQAACEWSGLSRATLYRLIKDGRLPIRKCGARTLVLTDELAACIRAMPAART